MNTNQYQHKSIAAYSTMAAIVTALVIWIAVSTMDYNDAKMTAAEYADYCRHVRDGLWPDWKGTYKPGCEGEVEL